MNTLPLSKRLLKYLEKHNLIERFEKQKLIFETNPFLKRIFLLVALRGIGPLFGG